MVTSGQGAKVVSLRRERERRLATQLAPTLETSVVVAPVESLDSVEEWRAAARMAGRANGWRVRTGYSIDDKRVWAVRNDMEPDEADLRDAADRLNGFLFGPKPREAPKRARSRRSTAGLFSLP